MTALADLSHAGPDITLSEANARLWDERLDCRRFLILSGQVWI
ncbi:hypothetical protein ACFOY2_39125 [Nonomuraea purpurea]|uniref:Uncharacterized protein n=1 Tax=Nonomuraea purpurea TaxID=1849276 RepID=A0ABV8GK74_9ACTN